MCAGQAPGESRGSRPGRVPGRCPGEELPSRSRHDRRGGGASDESEGPMSVKVKNVAILDDMNNVINLGDDLGMKPAPNFSTRVLGWNVLQLYVRVELAGEGVSDDKMPGQITVDVRTQEPGSRRIG